ncbi:MAG: glycosyltransferase family 8 protein [Trebonia sp.]
MRPEHNFAFAAQGRYSLPLAASVGSLLEYLNRDGRPVHLWVLDLQAEPGTRERVQRVVRRSGRPGVRLDWLQLREADVRQLPTVGHLAPATYARLLLPAIMPPEIDAVVYLDSDLVVQRDLSTLTDLDLGGAAIGAVQDFAVELVGSPRSGIRDLRVKPADDRYFNAGVLLMGLGVWRSEDLAERVFAFAQAHAPLQHSDQDALNAVISDWHELGPEWNVQSMIHWLDGAADSDLIARLRRLRPMLLESACVIHFSGPSKPWDPWYRNPDAGVWTRALRRSRGLSPGETLRWSARYYPTRLAAWCLVSLARLLRRRRRPPSRRAAVPS